MGNPSASHPLRHLPFQERLLDEKAFYNLKAGFFGPFSSNLRDICKLFRLDVCTIFIRDAYYIMTQEEKRNILEDLGISKESAEWYLKQESDTRAVLPVFRLLKPLNNHLVFYEGEYQKLIKRYKEEGKLAERMPEEAKLIESGASPEDIEKLAYALTLQAYEMLLYRMDDRGGAESPDFDLMETYEKCGYWKLMEISQDGEPTGRYLTEVHGFLPFSSLE